MVVVLPVPLTPTTRMTCGLCAVDDASGMATGVKHALDLIREDRAHVFGRRSPCRSGPWTGVRDARGRLQAEIGLDQQILELFERRRVELALGEEAGDAFGELRRGFRQPGLQPLRTSRAFRPARPRLGLQGRWLQAMPSRGVRFWRGVASVDGGASSDCRLLLSRLLAAEQAAEEAAALFAGSPLTHAVRLTAALPSWPVTPPRPASRRDVAPASRPRQNRGVRPMPSLSIRTRRAARSARRDEARKASRAPGAQTARRAP